MYSFNVPTFGPGVVYDVDQKVRTEQFRWFTEALKKERLRAYVPQFVMEAEVSACFQRCPLPLHESHWQLKQPMCLSSLQQYFAQWGNEGVVDFKEEFSKLITMTAARTLLGVSLVLLPVSTWIVGALATKECPSLIQAEKCVNRSWTRWPICFTTWTRACFPSLSCSPTCPFPPISREISESL